MNYHRDKYLIALIESLGVKASQTGKPGRPFEYANELIASLTIAQMHLGLALRDVCSVTRQIAIMANVDVALIPSFNRLSERQKDVQIIPAQRKLIHQNGRNLAVDSTLVSLAITGSSRVLKRNMAANKEHARKNIKSKSWLPPKPDYPLVYTQKRGNMANDWLKITIVSDVDTGEILAYSITNGSAADASPACFDKAFDSLPPDVIIKTVLADTAYDGLRIRAKIHNRGGLAIIKPPITSNYRTAKRGDPMALVKAIAERNQTLDLIAEQGWAEWAQSSGYSRRALVETVMSRHKTSFPRGIWAREAKRRITMAKIQLAILNENLISR